MTKRGAVSADLLARTRAADEQLACSKELAVEGVAHLLAIEEIRAQEQVEPTNETAAWFRRIGAWRQRSQPKRAFVRTVDNVDVELLCRDDGRVEVRGLVPREMVERMLGKGTT